MTRRHDGDEGFTLIDTLIAVVIMGTTVVAIVTVLSGVIVTSQYHRGNAVAEDVTHNAVEAVVARMAAKTVLTADVNATTTTLPVQNTAPFANLSWVAVDDEMMKLTGVGASSLTVQRAPGDAQSAAVHSSGTAVVPAFRCPTAAELTPISTGWAPAGVTAPISAVEYWNATTSSFEGASACATNYDSRCLKADGTTGDRRAACDVGLYRVTLTISTPSDGYKGVTATTQALIRRGSA